MRTFVISDAHGHPELIHNALEHGGFEPARDALVYAGDLLDRGPDASGCIALVEQYATEVLIGNHDLAAMLDLDIFPQHGESPALGPLLLEKVLATDCSKAWKAATCIEGVLITHAGVAEEYGGILRDDCQGDPSRLADYLNAVFLRVVARQPKVTAWEEEPLLGFDGPFWFRPQPCAGGKPLGGCRQVVGHSPPQAGLEASGFYMIDPCVFERTDQTGHYRYAVIEAGQIRVEWGPAPLSGRLRPARGKRRRATGVR